MLDPGLRGYRRLLRTRLRLVGRRTAAKNAVSNPSGTLQPAPPRAASSPRLLRGHASARPDRVADQPDQGDRADPEAGAPPDGGRPAPPPHPGIGERTAYTIVFEVDDITRFPSARHFFSYCRLVPGAKNSGGKTRHRPSKEGNRYLKNVFRSAAVRAIQYEPTVKAWYQPKLRAKGKPIAQTLVAKELARIVYHVLRDQVDFNGTFKGVPTQNVKHVRRPRRTSPDA